MIHLALSIFSASLAPQFGVSLPIPFVRDPLPSACAYFLEGQAPPAPGPVWVLDAKGNVFRGHLGRECPVKIEDFPIPGAVELHFPEKGRVVAFALQMQPAAPVVGIVTSEPPSPVVHAGPFFITDVTGDGTPEVIELCTSMEGFHHIVWHRSRPLPLSHVYGYVGYDTVQSCREELALGDGSYSPPADAVWSSPLGSPQARKDVRR